MSRLVVQHPHLTDVTVQLFEAAIGAPAALRRAGVACWDGVTADAAQLEQLADTQHVDVEIVRPGLRLADFGLIAFDMDSTLITIECVDEIADFVGRKAEVAAITEAAMRGEIPDYDESLRRRVALLAGLDASVLQRVYDERLRLSPGARQLIDACRSHGLEVLLVSGGFTFFTERLSQRLAIRHTRANVLEIRDGRLTGHLVGEIVNAGVKRATVERTCAAIGCTPAQAIVVGDGANDLQMMSIAGLSVAYRAKPIVRSETTHAINHGGLDAILNFFVDAP